MAIPAGQPVPTKRRREVSKVLAAEVGMVVCAVLSMLFLNGDWVALSVAGEFAFTAAGYVMLVAAVTLLFTGMELDMRKGK